MRRGSTRTFENPVGRGLARKRKMTGATQHQIAQATGIAVNRIVFIETGRCDPKPSELDAIRKVLKRRAQQAVDAVSK